MQQEYKDKDNIDTPNPQKKQSYVKKILKGVLYLVSGLVVFNILLFLLLSIPAVQKRVVDFAIGEVKKVVKTEVRIGDVKLNFWGNVEAKLGEVYIEDQSQDTLLYAEKLEAKLNPWLLMSDNLSIERVVAEDFTIKISQADSDSDFNFQFLIDAFAGDTTTKDTTASTMRIAINDIKLNNGRLRYDVFSEPETPGEFNASHIEIRNFYASLNLPSIDPIDLDANLESMSFIEKSGIEIAEFKGKLTSVGTTFYVKDVNLLLDSSNVVISDGQYNMLTDAFTLAVDKSVISPAELLPFMKNLKHLKNNIEFQASLSGKLPAVRIDSLQVDYSQEAQIKGSVSISDYKDYGKADLKLDITDLRISPQAINDFAKIGDSTFVVPDILNTLGNIRLHAAAHGSLANLELNAEATATQGALLMLGKVSTDTTFQNFKADIKLQTQNFNLGSLMKMPELGRLSAQVNLLASQTSTQSLKADIIGKVHEFRYDSLRFNNVPFTAYYNSAKMGVWLKANQSFGKLNAKVDMEQSQNPKIDLDVDLERLQINKFASFPQWRNPELSLRMKGNLKGMDLSKIQADMTIDSLKFSHDSLSFESEIITLKAGLDEDPMKKYIQINSSLFDAGVKGDYNFETLALEITSMMNTQLPQLFKKTQRKIPNKNNFNFYLTIQNTEKLGRILDLPIDIVNPLSLKGSLDATSNTFKMSANIPHLKYNDMSIRNTAIDIGTIDSLMHIDAKSLLVSDDGDIRFKVNGLIESDTIDLKINVKRDSTNLNVDANLDAKAHFRYSPKGELISSVQFSPSFMNVGKLNMTFMPARIQNQGNKTSISNFGLMVGKGRVLSKYFGVEGVVSDQPQDTLNVSFFHANLGNILQAFDVDNIKAIVNGDVRVTNALTVPELYTDNMEFSNIIIFGDTLGDLNLKSQWNNSQQAIKLDALLAKDNQNSTIGGWVYPEKDSLNLDVNVNRLSIRWLEPFMEGTLNKVSGSISTGLKVRGSISAPAVNGWLGVNDTYLGVDYTNVTYHIADTIEIKPNRIGFENLVVEDPEKNKASVNALVTHRDFEDIKFSLDMAFNDFMVLNTETRTDSLFYGKLYATGTANIAGNMDDIKTKIQIRNARHSKIDVLLPQTASAGVYQSIVYINTPDDGQGNKESKAKSSLPLNLAANITLSPTVTFGVVINPFTGDEMQVKGSGLINFSYDMSSETMNTFGDYSVSEGFVRLKLQNLVTMEFKIRDGSKLIFNGDPLNTTFDITAYKRVKANLTTLDENLVPDGVSPRVLVDCVLGITGNMNQMNLTYNISLPDASDDIRQRVNAVIVTDQQKVTQFASLLAIASFQPQNANNAPGGANIAESMLTGVASGALSAGLNTLFNSVIGSDWEVGTNFDSADGTFENMDMTVSLSRKFLDDKLEFNTNLGYRTDNANNNSFIGDFDLTYALSRAIKLKVFNKTNDRYYKQADMTQGVGVVYTREAKTIKGLFRFFRKKRPQRASEQQVSGQ